MTSEEVMTKMRERLHSIPLRTVANVLADLDAMPELDNEHRMVRAAVIDELCERCPEADKAFDEWAGSDDMVLKNGSAAIVRAVRALR